jgi:hypothetical protein
LEFFADEHRYTLDGSDVPSVTQVFAAEGLSGNAFWRQEHRDRGTAVHRVAHLITARRWKGSTVEEIIHNSRWDPGRTDSRLVPYGHALCRWLLDSGFQPVLSEQPVASVDFGVAGTLDTWGILQNGLTLLPDFKSGQPQEAAHLQTALYAALLEKSTGRRTDFRTVVWLKADGTYKEYVRRPPGGTDLAIAISAVNLFKWRQQHAMLA